MPTFTSKPSDPITVTGGIVSAFVAHNSLPSAELPPLIQSVHEVLVKIVSEAVTPNAPEPAAAAVSVRKSITPDYLVCLDDGLKFKSLRRHLAALGMTPDEYRAKWKLPADYPMVAPNYAAQRSALAKRFGFGQLRGDAVKRKGGRPRKETA
ncbi:MAG: MucR family transcriptional regulator [Methylocella sp.]|jgi:predicted transcriptional regulator